MAIHPSSGVDRQGDAAPAPMPGMYESDPVHDTRLERAPPRAEAPAEHAHTADGSAMDQPGPVLAMIAAAGLLVVAGAFVFAVMLATQPEAPVGAVNVSPAAQQPIMNEEGELLPVSRANPRKANRSCVAPRVQIR
jgi:hypothetical protein